MDEGSSFRRRRYVLRLLLALALPWVLIGVAFSGLLLCRELHRSGHEVGWLGDATLVWFFAFGFPGAFGLIAVFLLGIYRLVRYREYRHSWYGWVWLVFAWLTMCALGALH